MRYVYFISYKFDKGKYGNCDIYIKRKIKKIEHIRAIEEYLKDINNTKNLAVDNYRLLRRELW